MRLKTIFLDSWMPVFLFVSDSPVSHRTEMGNSKPVKLAACLAAGVQAHTTLSADGASTV